MILAALFIALQVLDWWTTRRVLSLGGTEKNPAMRWVLEKTGIWGLLAIKLLVGFGIGFALIYARIEWVLIPLCLAYGWVVWRNWKLGNDMAKKKKSGGTPRPPAKPRPNNKPKPKGS